MHSATIISSRKIKLSCTISHAWLTLFTSTPVWSFFVATFSDDIHLLLKFPSIPTNISDISLLHFDWLTGVTANTVGHFVGLHWPTSVRLNVVIPVLLLPTLLTFLDGTFLFLSTSSGPISRLSFLFWNKRLFNNSIKELSELFRQPSLSSNNQEEKTYFWHRKTVLCIRFCRHSDILRQLLLQRHIFRGSHICGFHTDCPVVRPGTWSSQGSLYDESWRPEGSQLICCWRRPLSNNLTNINILGEFW